MLIQQNHIQKKKTNSSDFMIINEINSLSFINSNSTHILIEALEKLKLAKTQASTDFDKLFYFKIEQKKLQMFISD